jgi:hypothetical protein
MNKEMSQRNKKTTSKSDEYKRLLKEGVFNANSGVYRKMTFSTMFMISASKKWKKRARQITDANGWKMIKPSDWELYLADAKRPLPTKEKQLPSKTIYEKIKEKAPALKDVPLSRVLGLKLAKEVLLDERMLEVVNKMGNALKLLSKNGDKMDYISGKKTLPSATLLDKNFDMPELRRMAKSFGSIGITHPTKAQLAMFIEAKEAETC